MAEELHGPNVNIDRVGNAWFGGTLTIAGALKVEVTNTSATSYTCVGTDCIVNMTSTAARLVTLPSAGSAGGEYKVIGVKDASLSAATATLTVKSAGGTIDGVAAGTGVTITNTGGALVFIGDGTNWQILASY